MKLFKKLGLAFVLCLILILSFSAALAAGTDVAKIGSTGYATLGEAVAAANAMTVGADETIQIVLLKDLDLEEKLVISKNMTISGAYTINRTNAYGGAMFSVVQDVKLVLKDLTVDGNNHWTSNNTKLLSDIQSMRPVYGGGYTGYVTLEAGAPQGNGTILGVSGHAVLDNVTFQNHAQSTMFWVGGTGKLELNDTLITHNTKSSAGILGNVEAGGYLYINEGTKISDNFGGDGNGLLSNIYGNAIINGGEICNNAALNCNGYVFMIYGGSSYCEMNGGEIYGNLCTYGWANGYNCAFYVYGNGSTFVMNGGSISGNYSSTIPGVANNGDSATIHFNGGTIENNYSNPNTAGKDFYGYCPVTITNTFTSESNRFYGNLINNGVLNGTCYFLTYTRTSSGNGVINGTVYISNGGKTTLDSGTWNGLVDIRSYTGSTLTVKSGATISTGPVRVFSNLTGVDPENATEAAAAQATNFVAETGANINVPVLHYHRLSDAQKGSIVVSFDYNGGKDAQNWSGIQHTSSAASYTPDPLPTPTKPGYEFNGWLLANEAAQGSLDMTGTVAYVPGTPITETSRYIAQWKVPDGAYTVTFQYTGTVPAGAPALPPPAIYEEGELVTLPVMILDGYTWEWDTSALNNGQMPTNDVTITGRWIPVAAGANGSNPPKTGDDSSLALWFAMLALSGAAMLLLRRRAHN